MKPWYIRWGTVLLFFVILGAGLAVPEIRVMAVLVDAAIVIKHLEEE